MKVLMLGSDDTKLVEEENERNAFVRYRHIKYASRIDSLHIVIKTLRDKKLKRRKLGNNLYTYPTLSKNRIIGLWDLYKIGAFLIRKENINLIVTSDPFGPGIVGSILKYKYKIPLCVQLFGDFAFNKYWIKESFHNRVVSYVSKYVFKYADAIRVHGEQVRQYIIERLAIDKDKVFVIPIFTQLAQFSCKKHNFINRLREFYSCNGDKKIVFFAGRFTPQKDVPNLLQAINLIVNKYNFRNAIFLLAGNGPLLETMRQLSNKLGLDKYIKFLGTIPYDEIGQYYHASDIFVLPSRYEDTARVLIEASICAKPIVTTDTTGASTVVIDNETGFIVPKGNSERLAEKILLLLRDNGMIERFSNNAKSHIEKLIDLYANEEKIIDAIINMWEVTSKR